MAALTKEQRKEYGIIGSRFRGLSEEAEAELVGRLKLLYLEEGYTAAELGAALDVGPEIVGALLRRHGVETRAGSAGRPAVLVERGVRAALKLPKPKLARLPFDGRTRIGRRTGYRKLAKATEQAVAAAR